MKHVTIKDIAVKLGLSVSTVSRALADDKNIKEETKKLVADTAQRMGYRRNYAAALLRSGKTGVIGVVVNEMLTPFASKVLEGIQKVTMEAGYRIQIANSYDDPEQERRNLQMMENSMVDGLIVVPCSDSANLDEFRRIIERGHPMVFFARSIKNLDVSKVVANDYDKAYYLTQHFIRSGRRRIVHVTGPDDISNYAEIRRGYIDCIKRSGLEFDPQLIVKANLNVKAGQDTADWLMQSGIEFDSIFACTDILAIGIMNKLRSYGVMVPQDVAIAGFSGSQLSQLVYPALTTVEPPLLEMGEKTAQLLLERIQRPDSEMKTIVLDSLLCLRESSKANA